MLPTVTPPARAHQEHAACRALDALLFDPERYFALGASNQRVPGVLISSLAQGHELIEQHGTVASIVGRLRPGFVAVDVDVAGVPGEAITDAIAAWCDRQDVWHVVRPSGGAPGRHHVITRPGEHHDALEAMVEQLRASWQASATMIDVRTALRPLSAPHRRGGWHAPYRPAQALAALRKLGESSGLTTLDDALAAGAASTDAAGAGSRRAKKREWGPTVAQVPRRTYARRPLPAKWQTYLTTGRKPAWSKAHSPTTDTSRSTYELMCTAAMLRAGMDAHEAWHAIETAHPDAMSRARTSWGRWVRAVWNVAVKSDNDFAPVPRVDEPILCATQEARDRLRTFAWTLEMRERVSVLTVATVLLHRMEREGTLQVPCPERDLVLDTGIRSRTTIRAALRHLDGVLGTLHTDTYDITKRATSSFEFEIPEASGVVRDIDPPSFHLPLAPALPGDLSPATWLTLAALDPHHALPAEDVALHAQLCPHVEGVSAWSRRQILQHLSLLQNLGLAQVSADGLWTRPPELPTVATVSPAHSAARERILLERTTFRARPAQWLRDQRAASAACRQRAHSWWTQLPESERELRRRRRSLQFQSLSAWQQQALKRELEERNLRRGIDPAERHRQWLLTQDPAEFTRRRAQRQVWFAHLPQPLRHAYAAAWQTHRRDFGYDSVSSPASQQRVSSGVG